MAEISDIQLNNISTRLEKISARMNSFGGSLTTISNQLSEASALERMKEQQQQQRDRQLAEQELRAGKESTFEKKMQSALINPMQRVAAPVQNVFERLKLFFTTMFGAWLTNQGFEALQSYIEGNQKKLLEIRDNVLNAFRKILVVYSGIKVGITTIIRTINGISSFIYNGVYKGLILRPFTSLMTSLRNAITRGANALGRLFGAAPKPLITPRKPPKGPGPSRTGKLGFFGGLATGIEAFLNLRNGEYMDTALAALTKFGPHPAVRAMAAAGFAADQIAEAFGHNIFGKDPNALKLSQEAVLEAEKLKQSGKSGEQPKADTKSSVQATEGLMGDKKDDKGKGVEANVSQASFKSEDDLKKEGGSVSSGGSSPSPATAEVSSTSSESSTPAQISSSPKEDMSSSVGPEPQAQPRVEILQSSGEQQSVPVEAAGEASSIPNIKSSNIENFYTLYSQINYNVVV
jgi:hypothetical protein